MSTKETEDFRVLLGKEFEGIEGKAVVGDLIQDKVTRRRRASHAGAATFSATVTITFPAGTSLADAKAAIKALPTAETFTYTVGGVTKTHKIDYAKVAETAADVTPPPSSTLPPSSAATVLSTVATVLIATVAALF